MNYLIYGLVFYALLVGFRYFIIFQRLLGITLQYPSYCITPAEKLLDYLKDFFQEPMHELETLGFQFCCYLELENIDAGNKRWGILAYHPRVQTFAQATTSALPAPGNSVNVDFNTFFEDGTLLLTVNGLSHGIIEEIPATLLQDPYAVSLEEQWQTHRSQLQSLQKHPQFLTPEAFVELSESHEAAYLNSLLLKKKIVPRSPQQFFDLTVATALKTAFKVGRGSTKQARLLRKRTAQIPRERIHMDIPVEVEVEAFHYLNRWEKKHGRKAMKLWGLAVSLGLFFIAATLLFDLKTSVILIGVLLFHELGHFFAMRWFGYRDTSIFFLPFFGAAASGRKDNATLSEQTMVLLAGPVPGLLLGLVWAIAFSEPGLRSSWELEVALWLVVLNYINLLPIFPLDGGKVVNLLIFSLNSVADLAFKIFAVSVLAIAGWGLGDPILVILGILVALSIPSSFRSAKILQHLSPQSSETLLPDIFRAIRASGNASMQFAQKYRLVKEIVQRYREPRASWPTRLLWLTFYLLLLLGGPIPIAIAF